MVRRMFRILATTLLLAATVAWAQPAPGKSAPGPWMKKARQGKDLYATFKTSQGDIIVRLFSKDAPKTVDNFVTLSKQFGKQTDRWNGIDINLNARLANGLFIQGGTSTGRRSTNNCEILAVVPEAGPTTAPYCNEVENWLTQVKGAASYLIPRVDVSVAATYQYLPGPEIAANWAVPNALVAPSLGRNLSGNAPFVTVNLVEPGTAFNQGLNQLDLRFAKILRFGGTRTTINFDLYNTTNANTVLTLNNGYVPQASGLARWQVPNAVLQPRFFKIGAQFDF